MLKKTILEGARLPENVEKVDAFPLAGFFWVKSQYLCNIIPLISSLTSSGSSHVSSLFTVLYTSAVQVIFGQNGSTHCRVVATSDADLKKKEKKRP